MSDLSEFRAYPKTPRLLSKIVVTEKIDGTNAAVVVEEDGSVWAQSRKRRLEPTKQDDNFGFAAWVQQHEEALRETLGVGRHFGEWWGSGIQRGYGVPKGDRYLSLFNVERWADLPYSYKDDILSPVPGLLRVPTLLTIEEDEFLAQTRGMVYHANHAVDALIAYGSYAAPGFTKPEGVIVFHDRANQAFKYYLPGEKGD